MLKFLYSKIRLFLLKTKTTFVGIFSAFKSDFRSRFKLFLKFGIVALALTILIIQIFPSPVRAGYSFQTNFNSGSYDAFNSLGSPTASTDTDLPSLNPVGYEGNNSLEYAYDGTSTLKYETASNLSPDKGSIEMKFQKSAYGNNVDQDAGSMYWPNGLDYDPGTEFFYIADRMNHRIIKTKLDGTGWQTFGHYGVGGVGQFNYPSGITHDSVSGYTYIFDGCNNRIVKTKFDGSGWATYGSVGSGVNQFNATQCGATGPWPSNYSGQGLDYDPIGNYLYIADSANNRVIKTQWGGTGWTAKTGFNGPSDVDYDVSTDYLYVANRGGNNVIKTQIDGTGWTALGGFSSPMGMSYDSATETLYVSDSANGRVVKTQIDGSGWITLGSFNNPIGIFFDPSNSYIYVSDYYNHRITKTQIDGTGRTNFGSYYNNLMKFSLGTSKGIAYDPGTGFYYIGDNTNKRIIKTRVDGSGFQTYGASGSGVGQFSNIGAVVYEPSTGYLYIDDYGNSRFVRTKMDGTGWNTYVASSIIYSMSLGADNYLYLGTPDNQAIGIQKIPKDFSSGLVTVVNNASYRGTNPVYDQASSKIYFTNKTGQSVCRMNTDASDIECFGSNGSGVGQFNFFTNYGVLAPYLYYDSSSQYFYIADVGNNRIVKTQWNSVNWSSHGTTGSGPGQFNAPFGITYDAATGYIFVADVSNNRFVRISNAMDGTGWQTTNDFTAKEKVLFSAQSTDDMRIVYDVMSRKIRFYLAYSNKAQFAETPTLSLTDGNWYTIKCSYNRANHTLKIDLDGVEQVLKTYDTDWGALSYGSYFYIGARNGSTTDRWDGMIDDIYIDTESIDVTAPTNPTPANTHIYSNSGKTTEFVNDNWGNAATPYITWSGASDTESGLKGYYLYFGTDIAATPTTTSGVLTPSPGYSRLFQTHVGVDGAEQNVTVPAASLTTGVTYYFRLRTQDNDLNLSDPITLFTYKYDGGNPDPVEFINVSPVGCSTASTFTFTWDAIVDPVSGIAGYEYKNGSTGAVADVGNVTTIDLTPYQEGDNIVYIRTKDNAGNVSSWATAVYCSTGVALILDGPTVTSAPSSLTVSWVSSKITTSYVQVYKGNEYVSEQGHTDYSITHNVKVVGLDPETAYRYKVRWLDPSGNQGESGWFQTATSAAPAVSNFEAEVISPTKMLLSWSSSESTHAILSYGIGSASTHINIDGYATNFSQTLDGLTGGTTYVVRIKSTIDDGYIFYSDFYSFSTPPAPEISGLRFEPLTDSSAIGMKVTWVTNVDTDSTIVYGPQDGGERKEISKSDLVKDHEIQINGLSDNTVYTLTAKGTDTYGNVAESDANSFTTPMDTRPPKISKMIIETSNVGLNREDKAQIAVSWETDEPATSFVEYAEGLNGNQYTNKTVEDKALTTKHLVVISELIPSKPYHLRVVSADKANNIGRSEDSTAITGEVPKSVLQLILKTLGNTFGWLSKFMGLGL